MPFEIRRRERHPSFTLYRRLIGPSILVAAVVGIRQITASSSGYSNILGPSSTSGISSSTSRTVQVQIIHRHGDRTPITSMKDEGYWASKLVPPEWQEKIAKGTHLVRNPGASNAHVSLVHSLRQYFRRSLTSLLVLLRLKQVAQGRGPYGKLTQLGLLQMIGVGEKLREDFYKELKGDYGPLRPENIRVFSTDFQRTIQSVQGVLVGLFPDGPGESIIPIDCRHTNWLIPDPQPRRSQEQTDLEAILSSRLHIRQRDDELKPLAIKCTNALRDMLSNDAFEVSYGIGEEKDSPNDASNTKPLSWAQLAEITKCLRVHNRLPEEITDEDIVALSTHTAWRWFENLSDSRLSFLAMNKFALSIMNTMHNVDDKDTPPVIIYSAHDSSLIGLLCAFRLEQPTEWPEYASYLKIELLEVTTATTKPTKVEYMVRFSLNGKLLRSNWHGKLRDTIPLHVLFNNIKTEGAVKAT